MPSRIPFSLAAHVEARPMFATDDAMYTYANDVPGASFVEAIPADAIETDDVPDFLWHQVFQTSRGLDLVKPYFSSACQSRVEVNDDEALFCFCARNLAYDLTGLARLHLHYTEPGVLDTLVNVSIPGSVLAVKRVKDLHGLTYTFEQARFAQADMAGQLQRSVCIVQSLGVSNVFCSRPPWTTPVSESPQALCFVQAAAALIHVSLYAGTTLVRLDGAKTLLDRLGVYYKATLGVEPRDTQSILTMARERAIWDAACQVQHMTREDLPLEIHVGADEAAWAATRLADLVVPPHVGDVMRDIAATLHYPGDQARYWSEFVDLDEIFDFNYLSAPLYRSKPKVWQLLGVAHAEAFLLQLADRDPIVVPLYDAYGTLTDELQSMPIVVFIATSFPPRFKLLREFVKRCLAHEDDLSYAIRFCRV